MRTLASVILFVAGLVALVSAFYLLFPNSEGVLDLSGLEWAFLILYGNAVRRVYLHGQKIGEGLLRAIQRVVNSAGVCTFIVVSLMVTGTFLAADARFHPATMGEDALAAMGPIQVVWLMTLLVAALIAAPSPPKAVTNPETLPIDAADKPQLIEEQVEVTK